MLASTKNAAQRIYLHSGIYGETTLHYYDGAFQACPHTYPDYLWVETLVFFNFRPIGLSRATTEGRLNPTANGNASGDIATPRRIVLRSLGSHRML